ncbi:MAG: hypothetical protein D3922_05270 [Candidatus Electrothrix sp. AR1]|nr:hypothetical protein [Candidatus Electrothrix sp. AR1]
MVRFHGSYTSEIEKKISFSLYRTSSKADEGSCKLFFQKIWITGGFNRPRTLFIYNIGNHIRNAGPRDFVQLFINAEFIVTDSFHGTCFAVNLGKRFIAIAPEKSSNRIESLLRSLEIEERIVSTCDEFRRECFCNDVDSEKKLSVMREKSLAFIEKAVAV